VKVDSKWHQYEALVLRFDGPAPGATHSPTAIGRHAQPDYLPMERGLAEIDRLTAKIRAETGSKTRRKKKGYCLARSARRS
jgi:hypothetical protein